MRIVGFTSANTVGAWNQPSRESPSVRHLAAAEQLRAFLAARSSTYSLTRLPLPLGDAGAHVDARLEAVADAELARPRDELLDELVVDLAVDEEARGRRAALAGRAEGAPHRAVDRQIQVGVFHDEDRVLAAHLQVQRA